MKKILFSAIIIIFLLFFHYSYAIELNSNNAVLIEMETGRVLYEKNADIEAYPASMTKMITAILTLENCELTENVTASYDAIMSVPSDGTTASIQVGETWTVQQLLEALLICSANEAANMLGEHIGGNISSFVSMMNAKAIEIGASSTHFENANGLHIEEHQSTAMDMALIARYAMQNLPEFRRIVTLEKFSLPATSFYSKNDRVYENTNKLIVPSSLYYYPYANGIKTGYTDKAHYCLTASAEKDGVELIAVLMGASNNDKKFDDAKKLLNYGFDMVKSETFLSEGEIVQALKIEGAAQEKTLYVASACDVIHTIPIEKSLSDYPFQVTLRDNLKAPIASGEVLGTIEYSIEGNTYQYDLIALNAVDTVLNTVATVALQTTKAIGKVIFWAVLSVAGIGIGLIFIRAIVTAKKQRLRIRRTRRYNARFR